MFECLQQRLAASLGWLAAGRPELARDQLVVAADGGLLARLAGSQASLGIGSLQGADLLLEIPAELGAQLLRLPIF